MLTIFFFKRFYWYFLVLVTAFIGIFSSVNFFLRFSSLQTLRLVPVVLMTMIPMVALFAIPFASMLAIQFVFINVIAESEKLFFFYFKRAQRAVWIAVALFSLSLVSFYTPLVMQWAPEAYHQGKLVLFEMAQQHISDLRENRFHRMGSGVTIFFKKKESTSHATPIFKKIFISFSEKNNYYLFSAQYGALTGEILELFNGSFIVQHAEKPNSYVTFERASISLDRFLGGTKIIDISSTKLMTIRQLLQMKNDSLDAFIELHKRCAQIAWLFLFPFLALLLVLYRNVSSFGFIYALLYSGLFYVIMHASLLATSYLTNQALICVPIFYFSPLILFVIMFFFCRKM